MMRNLRQAEAAARLRGLQLVAEQRHLENIMFVLSRTIWSLDTEPGCPWMEFPVRGDARRAYLPHDFVIDLHPLSVAYEFWDCIYAINPTGEPVLSSQITRWEEQRKGPNTVFSGTHIYVPVHFRRKLDELVENITGVRMSLLPIKDYRPRADYVPPDGHE